MKLIPFNENPLATLRACILGLYSEGHGVLSNSLFDPTYGSIGYSNELFHYDNDIVPIWTLNEMRGGHSGCMMWPGSNFEYQGQNCSFTQVLDKKMHWTKRIETIMSWFKDDSKPANLVMMYMEEPDEEGHAYSPDAEVVCYLDSRFLNYAYRFSANIGNRHGGETGFHD